MKYFSPFEKDGKTLCTEYTLLKCLQLSHLVAIDKSLSAPDMVRGIREKVMSNLVGALFVWRGGMVTYLHD